MRFHAWEQREGQELNEMGSVKDEQCFVVNHALTIAGQMTRSECEIATSLEEREMPTGIGTSGTSGATYQLILRISTFQG
ncbi:hypothetical protein ACRALDRAFT_207486 [Sodiomyces alcalophilus JCM 7366]|uniref:uncharacterized protein n=1 Tax=Sodiomyces alcalophilus JCM 7366 TaxID=591952 RepID=UPI0039B5C580